MLALIITQNIVKKIARTLHALTITLTNQTNKGNKKKELMHKEIKLKLILHGLCANKTTLTWKPLKAQNLMHFSSFAHPMSTPGN